MNADKDQLDSLTERVLGTVFEVTNTLGAGWGEVDSDCACPSISWTLHYPCPSVANNFLTESTSP
jgi:hypothetical protein